MSIYTADELVFIDESIFCEKTGWRYCACGLIGEENGWIGDAQRRKSWSILPAYTLAGGYLNCTAVKGGYFSTAQVLDWLES